MALMVSALAGGYWMVRGSWAVRALALAGALSAAACMGLLREGGLVIGAGGLVTGLAGWFVSRRPAILAVAVVVALAAGWTVMSRPGTRAQVEYQVQLAANRHIGHVFTEGYAYRLLDPRFYVLGSESTFDMRPDEMVRFLARAAVSFFVVPAPWQVRSLTQLAFVPEQVMWYCLVLLAVPGAWVGFGRDSLFAWLLLGYVATAVAVISPNSGNVGTLIRHRELVLPLVGCFGAVGLCRLLGWRAVLAAGRPGRAVPGDGATAGVTA
jgi:hypothetical protein